jgi:DNA-binding NarL/FixJ family response regulator
LLIADRLPLLLAGLASLVEDAGLTLVARCGDAAAAERLTAEHDPDIAVLDAALGLDILRRQRADGAARPRLMLLADADAQDALAEAVELEADGLVLRDAPLERVARCLEAVAAGEQWIDNDALRRGLGELGRREAQGARSRPLTKREADVARLAAKGLRNRDIAAALGLTEGTVKLHLNRVFAKLRVDGRAALAANARELGLA